MSDGWKTIRWRGWFMPKPDFDDDDEGIFIKLKSGEIRFVWWDCGKYYTDNDGDEGVSVSEIVAWKRMDE